MSIAITSMSPTYATPKGKVTVSGTITNSTGTAAAGLLVQLWSSSFHLASRAAMESYLTAPPGGAGDSPTKAMLPVASLPAHTSQRWSLTLKVSQVGMSSFGVYPLAAELSQGGVSLDAARTFLPFWPGKSELRTLKPVSLAWVWPLIDVPHRAACPALLNDDLAASLAGTGRLGQLLAVGSSALGRRAQLTWAIDPALLGDANVMKARYRTGGTATCTHGSGRPASAAARAWLAGVRSVTAQQDFFVTPYADVDVAALAHQGLDGELANAFADGRSQAQAILGQEQRPGGRAGTGPTGLIAWPVNGIADYGVLESLAANQIGTVILDAGMMPPKNPPSFTPTAVTTTPDGLGAQLHVLLADSGMEQILSLPPGSIPGSVPGAGGTQAAAPVSSPAASTFAREQWFLAETAMIAAEAPHTARAVVIAPPRRWNPGAGLASVLLNETVSSPWLRPASLAGLVAARHPAGQVARQGPPQHHVSESELKSSLLRQVRRLGVQIRLLGSILAHPGPRYLSTAVAAIESSAWRGGRAGRRTADQLLRRVTAYVTSQQQQVSIVGSPRVTLGGKSGEVPVSISNQLGQAVRVRLRVASSSGQVAIGNFTSLVTVDHGTQKTIKIPVRAAAAGSTTLTLWLTSPDGRLLRGSTTRVTVEATHFGTMAIVIIGVALAVFVLTAAGRAFRGGRGQAGGDGDPGDAQEVGLTGPDPAYDGPQADTVEPGAGPPQAAKEPDEHASTPGWAESR